MIEAGANLLVGSGLVWRRELPSATHELAREIFETMLRHANGRPEKYP